MEKLTAEEILNKHLNESGVVIGKFYVGYLYEAMEEYAKQQAIELKQQADDMAEAVRSSILLIELLSRDNIIHMSATKKLLDKYKEALTKYQESK